MKTIVVLTALLAAFGLRADIVPAAAADLEPAEAIHNAQQTVHRAVSEAKRLAEKASKDAQLMGQLGLEKAREGQEKALQQARRSIELARSKFAFSGETPELDEVSEWQPVFEDTFKDFLGNLGSSGRAPTQPLIIRTTNLDPAAYAAIQEDLTVMARILNKAVERELGREARDSAMGIALSVLPGSRRPQSIYLEGYGALFFVNVKFPVADHAPIEEAKPEKASDTTWEQTKRELYGPKRTSPRLWEAQAGHSAAEYDADQVDTLKKALLDSLKDAVNIRELAPEQSITVVVIGSRPGATVSRLKRATGSRSQNIEVQAVVVPGAGSTRESMLILSVKKSDVDAFAKGSVDANELSKRAKVSAY